MKVSLGPNINAQEIGTKIVKNRSELSSVYQSLSSGLRINNISDDSAGLAVANDLRNSSKIYNQAKSNISSGISLFSEAANALSELHNILGRIQELALEASSESIGLSKRQALDDEAQALRSEYGRIKTNTNFNDIALLDNSESNVALQSGNTQQSIINAALPVLTEDQTSVTTNTPTGIFDPASSTNLTGVSGDGVQLSDLNGDGNLDAIVGDSNKISILIGDGNGSFSLSNSYSIGFTAFNVTVGDFNNDGEVDIVSSGFDAFNDGYATVLLGAGNGTFSISSTFTAESRASYGTAVADLNSDGFLDLVTSGRTDTNTGQINVYFGNGSGIFGARTTLTMHGDTSREVKIGDVNGDGKLDIVAAGYTGGGGLDGKVSIRLGDGLGNFGAVTQFSSDTKGSFALNLEDIDGDNKLDIITGGQNDAIAATATFLKGNGNGTFQNGQTYNFIGNYISSVKTEDLDGDGNQDLVAGLGRGGIAVRFGDGTGAFGAATNYTVGNQTNYVTVGDVNSDGVEDIVSSAITSGAGRLRVNIGQKTVDTEYFDLDNISLLSTSSADLAYSVVDTVKSMIDVQLGKVEGLLSRLESTHTDLNAKNIQFNTAEARIRNVNVATTSSKISRLEIISDSATAVYAQANLDPELVLALLSTEGDIPNNQPQSKMLSAFPDSIPKARQSIKTIR